MEQTKRNVGDVVVAYNILPLAGNEVAPPLKLEQSYAIKEIYTCACGQEHYDLELSSRYNWITCYSCKKPIPRGDQIHWCYPLRFQKA